jgi:hypothetical protein
MKEICSKLPSSSKKRIDWLGLIEGNPQVTPYTPFPTKVPFEILYPPYSSHPEDRCD